MSAERSKSSHRDLTVLMLPPADKEQTFGQQKYVLTSRGGRGNKTSQRGEFASIVRPAIELVDWVKLEGD